MASANDVRNRVYKELQELFDGPKTADGVLVEDNDKVIAIKVTVKKDFQPEEAMLESNSVFPIPYSIESEEYRNVARCVREFGNLSEDTPLVKQVGARYIPIHPAWKAYHKAMNHMELPAHLVPPHIQRIFDAIERGRV